jgi:GNAT superfamily N-acetyltransferase
MIERISYTAIIGSPLIAEYAAESSIPEIGPIDPQWDTYAILEKSGLFHCFGAFHEGELVGFAWFLTPVLPHYGKLVATLESLFVSESFRAFGYGVALMQMVEHQAREFGCVGVLYSAPASGKLEKVLSHKKKCRRTNSVFFWSVE